MIALSVLYDLILAEPPDAPLGIRRLLLYEYSVLTSGGTK